jgi:nitrite reductase/ring-hydroxylating ferredoxin subunit
MNPSSPNPSSGEPVAGGTPAETPAGAETPVPACRLRHGTGGSNRSDGHPPRFLPASTTDIPIEREHYTLPPDGRSPEKQPDWWHDFPIDWPQDHYVARRDFTKFMFLTSLAFVVGQFWIGFQNYFRRRKGETPMVKIASWSALPVGSSTVFKYPGPHDDCVLIRLDDDMLLAYSQKCTHLACAVIPRPKDGVIFCPCHEGYFDLHNGEPIAGPPQRPLPRILLKRNGDDIYATGVELRTI